MKCDRENEEHVYDDLSDVCSSNEQTSGRLREVLDFFIFVFNLSFFFVLRQRARADGVLRHLKYKTHMLLVRKVFCLYSLGFCYLQKEARLSFLLCCLSFKMLLPFTDMQLYFIPFRALNVTLIRLGFKPTRISLGSPG